MRAGLPGMTALLYVMCRCVLLGWQLVVVVGGLEGGHEADRHIASALICSWLSHTMLCPPRENNLTYQRDSNEKFHFQPSGGSL